MKHKQFEQWILDEDLLNTSQRSELENHLISCKSCQVLQTGWNASRQLINNATHQKPTPGFSDRWQQTIIRKCQIQKVRRYRISMFILLVAAFLGTIAYSLATGSIMQSIANGITMLSDAFVSITEGYSNLGYWLNSLPVFVPVSIGFIVFGFFSAFMMAGAFFLWNLRQRKFATNEIEIR